MLICCGELREPSSGGSVINSWRSRVSIWYSVAAASTGEGAPTGRSSVLMNTGLCLLLIFLVLPDSVCLPNETQMPQEQRNPGKPNHSSNYSWKFTEYWWEDLVLMTKARVHGEIFSSRPWTPGTVPQSMWKPKQLFGLISNKEAGI